MKKVVITAKRSCDGFINNNPIVVDISRILGDHDNLIGIYLYICITLTGCRIQVILP